MTIDDFAARLLRSGLVPLTSVLDGTLEITDVSSRNRNHRVTWGKGQGLLVKEPEPTHPSSAATLALESRIYEACRLSRSDELRAVMPEGLESAGSGLGLVVKLVRDALPLWKLPREVDLSLVYDAIGYALGTFHRIAATSEFRELEPIRTLPAASYGVLWIHKPGPDVLQHISTANAVTLQILQEHQAFDVHLARLRRSFVPSTIVHGDLKADNVLVTVSASSTSVKFVDWELARWGDPAWDVGSVLQDALARWLLALPHRRGAILQELLSRGGLDSLKRVQAACRVFWRSYVQASGTRGETRSRLLARSIGASAARLIQRAYEHAQASTELPNHSVAMLQVAANLFADPCGGTLQLYGLPPPLSEYTDDSITS